MFGTPCPEFVRAPTVDQDAPLDATISSLRAERDQIERALTSEIPVQRVAKTA